MRRGCLLIDAVEAKPRCRGNPQEHSSSLFLLSNEHSVASRWAACSLCVSASGYQGGFTVSRIHPVEISAIQPSEPDPIKPDYTQGARVGKSSETMGRIASGVPLGQYVGG